MASKAKTRAAAQPSERSECPVSRADFNQHAKPMTVTIGDRQLIAAPKEFSTGSFGWFAGEKTVVEINGTPVKVQVGLNMIVVGSKEA